MKAMILRVWVLSVCCLVAASGVASGALGQEVDAKSELGQFRSLRSAGMSALDANDLTGAASNLAAASAILPDSPSILLLRTQVALKQKRKADAKAILADYLARGYVLDLGRNGEFNAVWDAALEDQLLANEGAAGAMQVTATLPGFSLTDAMTLAPESGQLYLSGIRTGKISALAATELRDVVTFRPGVAAYGLGLRDGKIWATTAATRQTESFDAKVSVTSKIVEIDPANGQIVASFADTPDRRFGHLLMGREDLYVIDTTHGEVLRLNGYQGKPQVLIPEGYMDSPMGLAESEDGTVLIVSDFISGLYRIDLTAGSMQRLAPPAEGSTLGFSSIAVYGHDLIAIQNGFKPNRIVRLRMSDDWSQIVSEETLLRSDKVLAQPTQGVVSGDQFVFVAKSQWDNMDDYGNPIKAETDPAVIGAVQLKP